MVNFGSDAVLPGALHEYTSHINHTSEDGQLIAAMHTYTMVIVIVDANTVHESRITSSWHPTA